MDAQRQTKGGSLYQALSSMEEAGLFVLGAATSLERCVVGNLNTPVVRGHSAQPGPPQPVDPPLLDFVEEQIRKVLAQVREATDIIIGIEKELS